MRGGWSPVLGPDARRGVSLAEVLLFTGLAVLLSVFASSLYMRGSVVTDETQKSILLQQDLRSIVEYLSRDVNAACWFLDAGAARRNKIVLIKYASDQTVPRLTQNLDASRGGDYPFAHMGEPVQNRLDAERITFEWVQAEQAVRRTQETGVFIARTDAPAFNLATQYDFQVGQVVKDREVLGSNVKQFDLYYFGYERTRQVANSDRGSLKQLADLQFLQGQSDAVRMAHTACVLVRVKAKYDVGVYSGGKTHHAPEAELVTKIWSGPKLRDEMYHEYWSSVDWDLTF